LKKTGACAPVFFKINCLGDRGEIAEKISPRSSKQSQGSRRMKRPLGKEKNLFFFKFFYFFGGFVTLL
jgi:hypothetical protein